MKRNGLSESLEDYAKRRGVSADDARPLWRAEGLAFLGIAGPIIVRNRVASARSPRVAPGVAVPVRMGGRLLTPRDVISEEP